MTALAIAGVGICAPGLPDWTHAAPVLRGTAAFRPEPIGRLAPESLPPIERRRANESSRLAMVAAFQAVEGLSPAALQQLPTVFSSADGDTAVLASLLAGLSSPPIMLSPTLFHNSVFNAPAAYWSLGCTARAASTTVCAGAASFAVGLCEARSQVLATAAPVLYVAYDMPFPAALQAFGGASEPFACAFLLQPLGDAAPEFGTIDELAPVAATPVADVAPLDGHFVDNAAAAGLTLLAAVARQRGEALCLPYLDRTSLRVTYAR